MTWEAGAVTPDTGPGLGRGLPGAEKLDGELRGRGCGCACAGGKQDPEVEVRQAECGGLSGEIPLSGKRALGQQVRTAMPGGGCRGRRAVVLGGWARPEEAGPELAVVVRSEGRGVLGYF